MDLGIAGKWALVCGASKGLGYGCALALAREGVNLVINARTAEALTAAGAAIRAETGVEVRTVACDITTEAGRLAAEILLDVIAHPEAGPQRRLLEAELIIGQSTGPAVKS